MCVCIESCVKIELYLGIAFEAYSPLGTPSRPVKVEGDAVLLDDPVVKEIATKHNCTPAQVSSHDSPEACDYILLIGINIICSSSRSDSNS